MALIRNVSDTARWIAARRGLESARKDALFHDPFADRLAGDKGRAILAALAKHDSGWSFMVRTKIIDDLIMNCVAEGCDRVLNLAAGFDVRPFRLALPESLEWIEADLPALMAEKLELLQGEKPRCKLRSESVDLSDPGARLTLLENATRGSRNVVVLTEGLLAYLEESDVRALAQAIRGSDVRFWILDIWSPGALASMKKRFHEQLTNSPIKFTPPDGVAYFERLGWNLRDLRSIIPEGLRLRRAPLMMHLLSLLPAPDPRALKRARWGGVLRFGRE